MSRLVCKALFAGDKSCPMRAALSSSPWIAPFRKCLQLQSSARPRFAGAAAPAAMGSRDGGLRPLKSLQFSSTAGIQAASCAFLAVLSKPTPTCPQSASSHLESWPPRCWPDAVKCERWVGTNGNLGEEEKQGQRRQKPVLQAKPWGLVVNTVWLML